MRSFEPLTVHEGDGWLAVGTRDAEATLVCDMIADDPAQPEEFCERARAYAALFAAAPEMYRVLCKAAQLLGQDDGADAGRAFDLIEACLHEIDNNAP